MRLKNLQTGRWELTPKGQARLAKNKSDQQRLGDVENAVLELASYDRQGKEMPFERDSALAKIWERKKSERDV